MFATFALNSCEKDNVMNSSDYYSFSEGVSILDDDLLHYIEGIESDSIIVFSGNIPSDAIPKVNTKLFVPVSEKTPYGMLVNVISVNINGNVYVTTSPLSLDEAFKYLSIDESSTFTIEYEGVFDSLGNPIDFEIVDTNNIHDTSLVFNPTNKSKSGWSWSGTVVEWTKNCIKIPLKFKQKSGNNNYDVDGFAYIGCRKFDVDFDISSFNLRYFNFEIEPFATVGIKGQYTKKLGSLFEFEKQLYVHRFFIKIPTGTPIPIIIPCTFYINVKGGLKGVVSASFTLQREFSCNCITTFKNGNWTSETKPAGDSDQFPTEILDFDVKGELYGGAQIGVIAGLYGNTTAGVGFNFFPNCSLSADFNLSDENLLWLKPQVVTSCKVSSEVYVAAKLFGLNQKKYSFKFPDVLLYSHSNYLLPNIELFRVYENGTSAEIDWKHGTNYFLYLGGHGAKTGTAIFDADGTTLVGQYKPSPERFGDQQTLYYYEVVDGLRPGRTYYAAPFAYWGNYGWYGKMVEFTTDASYHAGFRCAGSSYDNIYFDFSISENNSSSLDQTLETHDYDGDLERIHFTANYDANTHVLEGVIDYHFYDDPEERRQDGFSITLPIDDSGYIYCTKVIDNGGCSKMVRIYRNSSKNIMKKYDSPIVKTKCNIGDHR